MWILNNKSKDFKKGLTVGFKGILVRFRISLKQNVERPNQRGTLQGLWVIDLGKFYGFETIIEWRSRSKIRPILSLISGAENRSKIATNKVISRGLK